MNKNLIKTYALSLSEEQVKNFALKEGISISDEEASIFVSTIKERVDDILNGYGMEVIESKKDLFSENCYNKLVLLFNKYKKFID